MSDDDDYGDRKVLCARCGRLVPILDATPEEGDEWECLPCNRVWDKIEQLESKLGPRDETIRLLELSVTELKSRLEGALELAREVVRTYGIAGVEHPAEDRWDSREVFLMATRIMNDNRGTVVERQK